MAIGLTSDVCYNAIVRIMAAMDGMQGEIGEAGFWKADET